MTNIVRKQFDQTCHFPGLVEIKYLVSYIQFISRGVWYVIAHHTFLKISAAENDGGR